VILGINIILWFLATYPKHPEITQRFDKQRADLSQTPFNNDLRAVRDRAEEVNKIEMGEKLRQSFAGHIGRAIEPLVAPLGFDWKIGIGIIGSFAAREVFVSTMSTVYNVGEVQKGERARRASPRCCSRKRGPMVHRFYTPLLGITLMVFYVFALQCVSTVVIVRRERTRGMARVSVALHDGAGMGACVHHLAWRTSARLPMIGKRGRRARQFSAWRRNIHQHAHEMPMPMSLTTRSESVGETPTDATGTVALPISPHFSLRGSLATVSA